MIGEHPIKQILIETLSYWDHEGTAANVRVFPASMRDDG